jgi:chemotaxis protein CheZ
MSRPTAIDGADLVLDHVPQDELLSRVGQMTRTLHDSLRGLGFDKLIANATQEIPNARDRLDYVARMTEQAAQRVLNATDAAAPLQDRIAAGAGVLAHDWRAAMDAPFSEAGYRAMAERTLAHLERTSVAVEGTKQYLTDIMMAQDFQDLTGQVIKKVTELAHDLEQQLVQLLVDYSPAEARRDAGAGAHSVPNSNSSSGSGLLNGPQINPSACPDVVADQSQVDDLLESLGF